MTRNVLAAFALTLLICSPGLCNDTEADLLNSTDGPVRELVTRVLKADAHTLEKWAKDPHKGGVSETEFCPKYEQDELKQLFLSAAEWKRGSSVAPDQTYSEPRAQMRLSIFRLMSFRPTAKDRLLAILNTAKAVAPQAGPASAAADTSTQALNSPPPKSLRVRISSGVANCFLTKTAQPISPKQGNGTAVLRAVIGKDGTVMSVEPLDGDADFVRAATQAVQKWKYRPYYLSGQPVEFETQVVVRFQ